MMVTILSPPDPDLDPDPLRTFPYGSIVVIGVFGSKIEGLDTTWNSASVSGYIPPDRINLLGKRSEVAIHVRMKLRYGLSRFLSQVFTELETGRNVPLILTNLDTHFNTFAESVTSIGLGPLAFARLAELPVGDIVSEIYENISKIDMYLMALTLLRMDRDRARSRTLLRKICMVMSELTEGAVSGMLIKAEIIGLVDVFLEMAFRT